MANKRLQLLMNGLPVGELIKTASSGLQFRYVSAWLARPGARPISLSLPLIEKTFTGDVVYNFFDNLLPDNPQIRARIQARFQASTQQPFDLLSHIGRDCVGAIQMLETGVVHDLGIHCEPLSDADIAATLQAYQSAPLGMTDAHEDFRISIAGAQEKSALLYHDNQWCRPLGSTPTTHIFKLPIGMIPQQQIDLSDSCENEWLCAKIITAFGLDCADCDIAEFNGVKTLVVKRFDRKLSSDGRILFRLPQEDMCQALGYSPNLKYQADGGPGIKEIMHFLLGSRQAQTDRANFFKAQIIFWALAAIDGHAKNFSIHIEESGQYHLTPLYDVMSAYPLMNKKQLQKQKIKMAMALEGQNKHYKWHTIQKRHFLETAKATHFSLKQAQSLIEEVYEQIPQVIDTVGQQLPADFPAFIAEAIFDGLQQFRNKLT